MLRALIRTSHCVILIALALPSGGCMTLLLANNAHHMTLERALVRREPRQYRVVDAETGEPVAGAKVTALYNFDWMDDWEDHRVADADGRVTFKIAEEYEHLLRMSATATSYAGETDSMPTTRQSDSGQSSFAGDRVMIGLRRDGQSRRGKLPPESLPALGVGGPPYGVP